MAQASVQAIILAAGKSRRFKTDTSKLVYPLCGQKLILYPIKLLSSLAIPTTVIVGHQKELVTAAVQSLNAQTITNRTIDFIEQKEQKGTGHALAITQELWHADHILVMNGDMPLVDQQLIQEIIDKHVRTNATVTFVTAYQPDPTMGGYGRVIREGTSIKIVEARDCSQELRAESLINAGIYLFKREFLQKTCPTLTFHENSQEFYLTDLIAQANLQQQPLQTITVPFDSIRGVNTLKELWICDHIKRSELISSWMEQGVQFTAPQTISVDLGVSLGAGTTVGTSVRLAGATAIGNHCSIGDGCHIENSTIADNVIIHPHSIIKNATINAHAAVGPFAHVKERSTIGEHAVIGNFVEVVRSCVGEKTKIKHLSYIGDAVIGNRVNVGAGTVICNYDGHAKHQTIIKNDVFIGSNNSLIAPLTIGQGAMTAAGSTITDNVPEDALAIARARQVTKEGYAALKRGQHAFVGAQRDKSTIHENS